MALIPAVKLSAGEAARSNPCAILGLDQQVVIRVTQAVGCQNCGLGNVPDLVWPKIRSDCLQPPQRAGLEIQFAMLFARVDGTEMDLFGP